MPNKKQEACMQQCNKRYIETAVPPCMGLLPSSGLLHVKEMFDPVLKFCSLHRGAMASGQRTCAQMLARTRSRHSPHSRQRPRSPRQPRQPSRADTWECLVSKHSTCRVSKGQSLLTSPYKFPQCKFSRPLPLSRAAGAWPGGFKLVSAPFCQAVASVSEVPERAFRGPKPPTKAQKGSWLGPGHPKVE